MVEKNKISTLYFGQDTETYKILNKNPKLKIVGVSLFNDLVNFTSFNFADYIFKKIYFNFAEKSVSSPLLLKFYKFFLQQFTSHPIKKINKYILSVIENNHHVLDTTNTEQLLKRVTNLDIDLIVINSWWILPKKVIEAPKYGTINIHPSKLPQYRGSVPTLWSLKNGDKTSAITFMKLDAGMDTGNIIAQLTFPIDKNDNAIDLEVKISNIVNKNLNSIINNYLSGDIKPVKQYGETSKTAKYFEYMKIDWLNEDAIDIVNKINLYQYLWPIDKCYYVLEGNKIEFMASQFISHSKKEIKKGEYTIRFPSVVFRAKSGFVKSILFKDFSFNHSIILLKNYYNFYKSYV
jgi:methionyl-tRNA formyltransferase